MNVGSSMNSSPSLFTIFDCERRKTDAHGINTPLLLRGQKKLFMNRPIFLFCANSFKYFIRD